MSKLINPDSLAIITIWQEARGESYDGKLAVGEVIRNRMARNYSSDGTVPGTVLKDFQFSGWNTGDANRIPSMKLDDLDPVVIECQRAWNESKLTYNNGASRAKGAVLYCNLHLASPYWAKPEKQVAQIGNHTFYSA